MREKSDESAQFQGASEAILSLFTSYLKASMQDGIFHLLLEHLCLSDSLSKMEVEMATQ